MYDMILKNGLVFTGDKTEPYQADIGIKEGLIANIGNLDDKRAEKIIEAKDKIVCPGFIDIHAHDEIEVLRTGIVEAKLRQGVTTVVNGNCGISFFPIIEEKKSSLIDCNSRLFDLENIELNWDSLKCYSEILNERGIGINVANLIGHGTLRIAVMGFAERKPSNNEMKKMVDLLEKSIEGGAFGLSSGLLYPPSSYADKAEIEKLCKILADNELIYATHMRNESDKIVECIEENIEIAKETGVSVEISHINVSGQKNWGKSKKIVKIIEAAQAEGVDINCDQYPYQAGSTFLTALLPQWTLNEGMESLIQKLKENKNNIKEKIKNDILTGIDGWDNIIKSTGWENIVINSVNTAKNRSLLGKNLAEIAEIWGMDCFSTLFRLLIEEEGKVAILIFSVCDEDFYRLFKSDFIMVGTDGIKLDGKPHPRLYGSYPRVLGKFVKEEEVISLKKAIRKMTSLPAEKLGLKKRGKLKEGYHADIVIFDYDKVRDFATYSNPVKYPQGIEQILVNGKLAYKDEKILNKNCGSVLLKN